MKSAFLAGMLLASALPIRSAEAADTSWATPAAARIMPGGKDAAWAGRFRDALERVRAAGGGSIRLEAGRYLLGWSDTLLLEGVRNLVIEGAGPATRIVAHPDSAPARYFLKLRECDNVQVRNLAFEGAALPAKRRAANDEWHTGISVQFGERLRFHGCRFSGFFTGGIHLNKAKHASITSSRFAKVDNKQAGDYGAVHLQEVDDVLVQGNDFQGIRYSAISGWEAKGVHAVDNAIGMDPASPYGMGMYFVGGLENSILASNRISRPANEGIAIQGRRGQPVRGNLLTGNTITASFAGIALNDTGSDVGETRSNVLSANAISGTAADPVDHGILIHGGERTRISGNTIRRCRIGISLRSGCARNSVTGNTVRRAKIGIASTGEAVLEENSLDSASDAGILVSHSPRTSARFNVFGGATPSKIVTGDAVAPGSLVVEPAAPGRSKD